MAAGRGRNLGSSVPTTICTPSEADASPARAKGRWGRCMGKHLGKSWNTGDALQGQWLPWTAAQQEGGLLRFLSWRSPSHCTAGKEGRRTQDGRMIQRQPRSHSPQAQSFVRPQELSCPEMHSVLVTSSLLIWTPSPLHSWPPPCPHISEGYIGTRGH